MRVGVVAVHGVIPQQRYGFQDQVASQLCTALNALSGNSNDWLTTVVFQSPAEENGEVAPSSDPTDTPTISRVHRANETDPQEPLHDFFDVREAYWSPIDKGKTTGFNVLRWLLTTIFLPINDTARYTELFQKVAWDIGYLVAMAVLGIASLLAALLLGVWALGATPLGPGAVQDITSALAVLSNPTGFLSKLSPQVIGALIAGVVGGYLAAQTIRACWSLAHNARRLLSSDPIQLTSRIVAVVIMLALSIVGILVCFLTRTPYGNLGVPEST